MRIQEILINMAAIMDIQWDFGGSDNSPGTQGASVTNLRFNAEDTNDQDTASPVIKPATPGVVFSFWKQLYMKATTGPDTQVDNVKLFTDGALGWGAEVVVNIGDELPVHNSGATTGYDVANAQETMTNHTDITAVTSLFTFTSGANKSLTISEAGSIINANNETTNYIVLQATVDDNAVAGTKPTETVTWQYDEI